MIAKEEFGLVHLQSPYSVSETLARLEEIVAKRGLAVLAHIDHSGDAAKAGLTMAPTQLLIFGNAAAGTPLMVAVPAAAIDLPLKALAWQDASGDVWLSYNSVGYLQSRYSLSEALVANIRGISAICEEAVRAAPSDKIS